MSIDLFRETTTPGPTNTSREVLEKLASERILLLGIPGAGKTTTCELLRQEQEGFNYISLGAISRSLPPESPEARQLEELFKTGEPSGLSSFFLGLVDPYLRQAKESGFILDGIPKTPAEVEPLFRYMDASLDAEVSLVVHLRTSIPVALGRIGMRGFQDSKDTERMYQRRAAIYEPTVLEVKLVSDARSIPWIELDNSETSPQETVDSIIRLYEQFAVVS